MRLIMERIIEICCGSYERRKIKGEVYGTIS